MSESNNWCSLFHTRVSAKRSWQHKKMVEQKAVEQKRVETKMAGLLHTSASAKSSFLFHPILFNNYCSLMIFLRVPTTFCSTLICFVHFCSTSHLCVNSYTSLWYEWNKRKISLADNVWVYGQFQIQVLSYSSFVVARQNEPITSILTNCTLGPWKDFDIDLWLIGSKEMIWKTCYDFSTVDLLDYRVFA